MARASDDYVSSMQKPNSYMWKLEQQLPKRRFQQWQPTKKPDSTPQWRDDQQAQPTVSSPSGHSQQTRPQQHQQSTGWPSILILTRGHYASTGSSGDTIGVNTPSKNILLVDKKATTPAEQTLPKLYMIG